MAIMSCQDMKTWGRKKNLRISWLEEAETAKNGPNVHFFEENRPKTEF